ncbi:MAG: hypothetical protein HZB52_07060 [Chloroflexi bacterium]|nr:hypothetical protein [Chloroflexota bacterium]
MKRHAFYWLPLLTLSFILASIAIFWTTSSAEAQCGSQASSCKNCHEVQGKKPINNDGKAWHTSHAFGDFCQFCHSGNVQSMDQNEAHKGMAKPLADVKLSCTACHQKDYVEKAQVYATMLGVALDTSGGGNKPTTSAAGTVSATQPPQPSLPAVTIAPAASVGSTLIDFNQQYAETIACLCNVQWQQVILVGSLVSLLVVGGFLIIRNGWWVNWLVNQTQKLEEPYPTEVAELMPVLANLESTTIESLRQILAHPQGVEKILSLMPVLIEDENPEA